VETTGFDVFADPEVQRAAQFAAAAHRGQFRRTGEPYVVHAVETARILAALIPSTSPRSVAAVVASLLHDVVDDTATTVEEVAASFGAEVASIVASVTRLSQLNQLLRRHRRLVPAATSWEAPARAADTLADGDGEALRALVLQMVDDPRVVLVKLADRLHNMRTLYALPAEKARAVAGETLGVWCSLASSLGVWALKAELEDLCFAVLLPDTFAHLKLALDSIWSGDKSPGTGSECDHVTLLTKTLPTTAMDEILTPGQRTTRALLACVLPFDLLTPRLGTRSRGLTARSDLPDSAASAIDALMACQRVLRAELRLSAVVPGLEITVQGRLKSLWSTHVKMQRKQCTVAEVYDARALRVVVEDVDTRNSNLETEACYSLLAAIHKLWRPVSGEYDDYVARPKKSGYQSLHTAVRAFDGAPLEVQVRTKAMHEEAEWGSAAHWMYKEAAIQSQVDAAGEIQDALQLDTALPPIITDTGPPVRAFALSGEQATRRSVGPGSPLLRVADGRLNDAVVVGADEGGRRLLVAVQTMERWGAAAGRRWTAAEYGTLLSRVTARGWFSAGQGDWTCILEEYALCSDGRYHKLDAYGQHLAACVELLDLAAGFPGSRASDAARAPAQTDDKVRLLRSLLNWENDLRGPATDTAGAAVVDPDADTLVVVVWPAGRLLRLPPGSTGGDVAGRMGRRREDIAFVSINARYVPAATPLASGDVVIL